MSCARVSGEPRARCYTREVTWKAKDRGLWLTLAALTVLLVALAALQYRWTSEIGRAEAERRQTQLERSAWRFANGFDREMGQLLVAFFRMEPLPPDGDPRAQLLERLAAWRRDEHAALLASVLLATRSPSGAATFQACGIADAAFHDVPWTSELEPLRRRLQATEGGKDGSFVRPGSLLEAPPAVQFPIVDAGSGPPSERWGRFRVTGIVLLRLDPEYLRAQLLPQLAEAHFGPVAESEFVVSVVRRRDRSVLFSTEPGAGGFLDPRPSDVERSLPGRGGRPGPDRPDARPGPRGGDRPPDDGHGREARRAPEEESPWLLVARHRGGSLEDTVATVRTRNLAVGFGVLALLGATAVLLATGAQRARRLARQQMEFVAGVTHELNTPLAAIRSAGQNLADGIVKDPAQVRRYGGLIEKEGGRLTALVAQVLDFAGIESGSRAYASEPLEVAPLVDGVLRDHRLALEQAGMAVETDLAPGPAAGPGRRGRAATRPRQPRGERGQVRGERSLDRGAGGPPGGRERGRAARRGRAGPASRATSASGSSSPSTAEGRRSGTRRRAAASASASSATSCTRTAGASASRGARPGARPSSSSCPSRRPGRRGREPPRPAGGGRADARPHAHGPPPRRGLRGRLGRDRRRGAPARAGRVLRHRPPRRRAPRQGGLRRPARPAPAERRHAGPHADRPRPGRGPRPGAEARRRRLRAEAVRHDGAAGADRGGPPAAAGRSPGRAPAPSRSARCAWTSAAPR